VPVFHGAREKEVKARLAPPVRTGERRIEALHKVMSNVAYRERLNEAVEAIKSGRELAMPKEGEMYLEDLSESVTAALESGMRVK